MFRENSLQGRALYNGETLYAGNGAQMVEVAGGGTTSFPPQFVETVNGGSSKPNVIDTTNRTHQLRKEMEINIMMGRQSVVTQLFRRTAIRIALRQYMYGLVGDFRFGSCGPVHLTICQPGQT